MTGEVSGLQKYVREQKSSYSGNLSIMSGECIVIEIIGVHCVSSHRLVHYVFMGATFSTLCFQEECMARLMEH